MSQTAARKNQSSTMASFDSSTSSSSPRQFVCVHCNTPCGDSLYRYLTPNSLASIKMTLCCNPSCGMVADPYLEREYLLIAMDWVLLRPPAYRHVLNNQLQLHIMMKSQDNKEKKSSRQVLLSIALRRMVVVWGVVSAILEAYLQWQVVEIHSSPLASAEKLITSSELSNWWALQLVLVAWVARTLVWWLTYKITTTALNSTLSSSHHDEDFLAIQLYMAWIIPTAMYGVAVMVMIWERTPTVTSLTTLLVLAMQFTALSSLLVPAPATQLPTQQQQRHSPQKIVLATFVFGIVIQTLIRKLVPFVVTGGTPVPCLTWSVPPIEPWSNDWWTQPFCFL